MALATTCPQCKTSFKVVPDQLKLRRGLVRCGVCQHVFSGVEHLRYVDKDENTEKVQPADGTATHADDTAAHEATATAAPPPVQPAGPAPSPEAADEAAPVPPPPLPGVTSVPGPLSSYLEAKVASADEAPAASASSGMGTPLTDEAADDTTAAPPPEASAAPGKGRNRRRGRNRAAHERPAPPPVPEDDNLNTVFFMADHDDGTGADDVRLPDSLRAAPPAGQPGNDIDPDTVAAGKVVSEANRIWRQHKSRTELEHGNTPSSPPAAPAPSAAARAGIGAWFTPPQRRWLTIGLAVLAVIQLLAVFRTEIAYRLPFLRPLASLASTLTGQEIQPPMSLATLSIESFELRGTPQAGRTRLTAILRNRSHLPARWPAMELTLTGPSNTVLVRKVLLPHHYLPATQPVQQGIAANTEFPLDLLLDTDDLNLAGYSVALFYPQP
ncbi:MAG: DUF3426 domain-containing protein [Lautropia sp.]|nr:DUF3426 domain-containing protein [Lautropia sp.]